MNVASEAPTQGDAHEAETALRLLASSERAEVITLAVGEVEVVIPHAALRPLTDVLAALANGSAVTVVPHHAELTTQQAADLLNVSRPYLVEQLEAGHIPFHRVGTHRRIKVTDLMAYQRHRQEQSRAALQELTDQAQELGLGY